MAEAIADQGRLERRPARGATPDHPLMSEPWWRARMTSGEPFEIPRVIARMTPYWQWTVVLDAATGAAIKRWAAADAGEGWVDLYDVHRDGRYVRDTTTGRVVLTRRHTAIRIVVTPARWLADTLKHSPRKPSPSKRKT